MWSMAKVLAVISLFGVSFISGISSFVTVSFLARTYGTSSKFKRIIGLFNCITGGVFFATSILELLPEARERMKEVLDQTDLKTDYPCTELLVGVGFFIIMCIEHSVHRCLKVDSKQECQLTQTTFSRPEMNCESSFSYKKLHHFEPELRVDVNSKKSCEDALHVKHTEVTDDRSCVLFKDSHSVFSEDSKLRLNEINKHRLHGDDQEGSNTCDNGVMHEPASAITTIRTIVLLLALSVHMIFDGIAVGLLKTDSKIWELVLALSIHKALAFFTIGLQICEKIKSLRKSALAVFLFALVSPVGVLVGDSIISNGDSLTRDTIAAILQGLATGTFIFVTFFEILQRELGSNDHNLFKVIAAILGFALVAVIRLFQNAHEGGN